MDQYGEKVSDLWRHRHIKSSPVLKGCRAKSSLSSTMTRRASFSAHGKETNLRFPLGFSSTGPSCSHSSWLIVPTICTLWMPATCPTLPSTWPTKAWCCYSPNKLSDSSLWLMPTSDNLRACSILPGEIGEFSTVTRTLWGSEEHKLVSYSALRAWMRRGMLVPRRVYKNLMPEIYFTALLLTQLCINKCNYECQMVWFDLEYIVNMFSPLYNL